MSMRLPLIAVVIVASLAACAQTPSQRDIARMSGGEMYQSLCASCHGVDGKGDGPVASSMKSRVTDLTRLAHRDGGEFPTEDVRRTIDGRFDRPAHGPRDMPVWGWQFYNSTAAKDPSERARVDALIDRLVVYLRSIQVE